MRGSQSIRRYIVLVLVFAIAAIAVPRPASADWVDRSNELPGMSGKQVAVFTAVAAAGGLAVIMLLRKAKGDKATDATRPDRSAASAGVDATRHPSGPTADQFVDDLKTNPRFRHLFRLGTNARPAMQPR